MWLLSGIIIFFMFLLILVIISTSMKIGLIITNRHNYDSRLLIIPSILSLLLWAIALYIFYIICQNIFVNGFEDMILTITMTPELIENKNQIFMSGSLVLFVTVILQSFTYYAINIDYGKIWGYIRFKIKQILKIKPKDIASSSHKMILNEEKFNVPFYIALLTSILSFVISAILIVGCYKIGIKISQKIVG